MTDILLIQPPIRDFYLTSKRTIPYGLASIAAVLIENGFSVSILDGLASSRSRNVDLPEEMFYLSDYYGKPDRSPFALFNQFKHFGYSFEHIGKKARASRAFLIGISSLFTPYTKEALKTAETVKAYCPECKIVFGGHHPTAMPEAVIKSDSVDFVLRGEGEVSMPLLAKAVVNGGPYDAIPGLVFRQPDGKTIVNAPAKMSNLDHYPLPAAHLIDHKFYKRAGKGSTVIVASRGCPMKCTFCSVGASSYLKYRRRSVDSVLREIDVAVAQYDVRFIDFEDESLALERQWILNLLVEINRCFGHRQLELRAMNGLFPPSLDNEVVGAMKEAGFKTLNLSLASTSEEQLKRFQRRDVRKAFDRALNLSEIHDLKAVGYIIIAAPFQSAENSVSDLLFLAQRKVLAGVSIFYPVPGSRDFDACKKLKVLPKHFSCMRSSALPLSHTTTRLESITLLRLGRILNFMKSLCDMGSSVPNPSDQKIKIENLLDRVEVGGKLLQSFLHDGKIRGISPDGDIYEHKISTPLTQKFIEGLKSIDIRGWEYG